MIDYTLKQSKRKTLALYVRNGNVEVRAPLNMPKRDIDRFVASKEKWITDRLTSSREQTELRDAFALNYGDTIMFRGKGYAITSKEDSRAGFDGETFYMPSNLTPEQIKYVCVQIYRRLSKIFFSERVSFYAEKMGQAPLSVRISSAKTRWGSCSSKKSINFSWRLIMADDDVIDYVVVHELAHLVEMNHSARFWAIVERVMPDYSLRRNRLRELQQRLAGEDWE